MGREPASVQYHEGEFVGVGSDGGYLAPNLEDIEDGLFPMECLSEEAKVLVRGYSVLRKLDFFSAGVGLAILCYSVLTDIWLPAMLYAFCALVIGVAVDVGKKALKEAIDSEAERREEILHYRKLNQMLCLREFRKGADDGRTNGEDPTA